MSVMVHPLGLRLVQLLAPLLVSVRKGFILSIVLAGLLLPAGQAPPSALAESTNSLLVFLNSKLSPSLPNAPVKNWLAVMSLIVVSSVLSNKKNPFAGIVPFKAMAGTPSVAFNDQPVKSTSEPVALKSSIHSSASDASVPAQATSFMTTVFVRDLTGVGDLKSSVKTDETRVVKSRITMSFLNLSIL